MAAVAAPIDTFPCTVRLGQRYILQDPGGSVVTVECLEYTEAEKQGRLAKGVPQYSIMPTPGLQSPYSYAAWDRSGPRPAQRGNWVLVPVLPVLSTHPFLDMLKKDAPPATGYFTPATASKKTISHWPGKCGKCGKGTYTSAFFVEHDGPCT